MNSHLYAFIAVLDGADYAITRGTRLKKCPNRRKLATKFQLSVFLTLSDHALFSSIDTVRKITIDA